MSTLLTQGIILKKSHYNDYDRQYVIYTRDQGKILAVAKGAKRITSKLNSHLDYFLISTLMLAKGSVFFRLAGAQLTKKHQGITNNLERQIISLYFLEMIDQLVKYNFTDQIVFDLISDFFSRLSSSQGQRENLLILNKFLFDLLSHLGYCPIIRSKNQKELINELNTLVLEISEKEIKSFNLLIKLF